MHSYEYTLYTEGGYRVVEQLSSNCRAVVESTFYTEGGYRVVEQLSSSRRAVADDESWDFEFPTFVLSCADSCVPWPRSYQALCRRRGTNIILYVRRFRAPLSLSHGRVTTALGIVKRIVQYSILAAGIAPDSCAAMARMICKRI